MLASSAVIAKVIALGEEATTMDIMRSRQSLSGLAGAILAMLALGHADRASAATLAVTNCNDHGPGSLRHMVKIAASGDTVDLQALRCRRIELGNGEIAIPQADLAIIGRGRHELTIDGNRLGRIFLHSGTGTLQLLAMSITRGYVHSEEAISGGCILSAGRVELRRARVFSCEAYSYNPDSTANSGSGGGIAAGSVLLWYSSVYYNQGSGYGGYGGGISTGDLTLYHAQLYGNHDTWGGGAATSRLTATSSVIRDNSGYHGGGVYVTGGSATVQKSTISGNRSDECGAGLCVEGSGAIVDSTISGNINGEYAVAGASFSGDAAIYNSTVAFNQSGYFRCVGVQANLLHVEGTIIANNSCLAGPGVDVGGEAADGDSVIGARNLIGTSTLPLPADTIRTDPRLAPLADNGGPTLTHALLRDSPAINTGSNLLDLLYDQRGPGYPRVHGTRADIGAFER